MGLETCRRSEGSPSWGRPDTVRTKMIWFAMGVMDVDTEGLGLVVGDEVLPHPTNQERYASKVNRYGTHAGRLWLAAGG